LPRAPVREHGTDDAPVHFKALHATGEGVHLNARHRRAVAGPALHPGHRPVRQPQVPLERLMHRRPTAALAEDEQMQGGGFLFAQGGGQAAAQGLHALAG